VCDETILFAQKKGEDQVLENLRRKKWSWSPQRELILLASMVEKYTNYKGLYLVETSGISCRRTDDFYFYLDADLISHYKWGLSCGKEGKKHAYSSSTREKKGEKRLESVFFIYFSSSFLSTNCHLFHPLLS
jgi:uncharacterized membrane protein YvbJ